MYYQEPPSYYFSHTFIKDAGVGLGEEHTLAELWVTCHRNICARPGLPGMLIRKRQGQTNTNNAAAAPGSEGI